MLRLLRGRENQELYSQLLDALFRLRKGEAVDIQQVGEREWRVWTVDTHPVIKVRKRGTVKLACEPQIPMGNAPCPGHNPPEVLPDAAFDWEKIGHSEQEGVVFALAEPVFQHEDSTGCGMDNVQEGRVFAWAEPVFQEADSTGCNIDDEQEGGVFAWAEPVHQEADSTGFGMCNINSQGLVAQDNSNNSLAIASDSSVLSRADRIELLEGELKDAKWRLSLQRQHISFLHRMLSMQKGI